MDIDISGFTVTRCCIDYRFSLDLIRPEQVIRGQEHASLIIDGHFEYVAGDTTTRHDPEQHPEELGPVLKLFRRTVEAASIAADGTLHIQFSDQMSIRVPSLFDYEAWELHHDDGRMLICMPGGNIAVWSARSTRAEQSAND